MDQDYRDKNLLQLIESKEISDDGDQEEDTDEKQQDDMRDVFRSETDYSFSISKKTANDIYSRAGEKIFIQEVRFPLKFGGHPCATFCSKLTQGYGFGAFPTLSLLFSS